MMRTEKEMFALILGIAERDGRIRAVYMNGSRANPNIVKDQYQDFDIVYVVRDHEAAQAVGRHLGYAYNQSDEDNMMWYLRGISHEGKLTAEESGI